MTRKSSEESISEAIARRAPADFAPDGVLRREDFTRERITQLREIALEFGQDWIITHDERDANRAEATKHLKPGQPIWVFGYGSLMWNPAFHVASTERATIYGYHRSFCLNLVFGRGAPDNPGLMLGLDSGGSCVGLVHKIAPEHVESELEILWMREMIGKTYLPTWVTAHCESGPREALTFAANKAHDRYIGPQPFEDAAARIARSEGILGKNRDYLYNTIKHLDEFGIGDGPLHRLEREVRRIAGEPRPD
jgi:cation transport protein ChaC